MARLYLGFDDFENLKLYAEKSLELDDEYGFAYCMLSTYYYFSDNYSEALKYSLIAEDYGYVSDAAFFRQISACYNNGETKNFLKSIEYATKAIKVSPKNAYNYYWKGEIYFYNDDYENALKYFQKAKEKGYSDFWLYFRLSYCNGMLGYHDKAIEYANQAIFLEKDNDMGYYRKGFAYFQSEKSDDNALEQFLIAEKLGNNAVDMLIRMIYIYSDKGDYDSAMKRIKKAKKLLNGAPDYEFYCAYIGTLLIKNRFKKISEVVDEALKFYPNSYLLTYKATALFYYNKFPEFEKVLRKFQKAFPDDPFGAYLKGLYYFSRPKNKNYRKSIELLKQVEDFEFGFGNNHFYCIAISYFKLKKYEESICYFQKFFSSGYPKDVLSDYFLCKKFLRNFSALYKLFPTDIRLQEIENILNENNVFL
ncbi:MAG: tetratricopeptide repeat protein [Candidatus Gastranaerophilaceae bacterium]